MADTCGFDPTTLAGQPMGMLHCPECGQMVLAGLPHLDWSVLDDAPEGTVVDVTGDGEDEGV